ncbi:MAG: Asp-tRNA(Asn)/Glu-tRNA(Gln) amidotransferase subunit GatB [Phycisphaerales bacterium]
MAKVVSSQLKVGLEIHIELATRSKMFARAPSPGHRDFEGAGPNSLIDPTVLGLPGALPVLNREAIEMSMRVGVALGCAIAPLTRWDRKSYFYPDMPKNYQISQYQLPLCFDGSVELPGIGRDGNGNPEFDFSLPGKSIGIIRAHLEEDAGKLLHEAPGGTAIDGSIVDLNRAGTPLLEIVTQPDFSNADEVVVFAQMLRTLCRFLGVTQGVMQKGHMRFEPNINMVLTLEDGRLVTTPIVEVKNLNSFKALRGAIESEQDEQPRRWEETGAVFGPGSKSTRGWEEAPGSRHGGRTVLQREKEDAHDYRYFPDPDLLPVRVGREWVEAARAATPELPVSRMKRYMRDYAIAAKEAAALVEERADCEYFEATIRRAIERGVESDRAGKQAANFVLQSGAKRANERAAADADLSGAGGARLVSHLGVSPDQLAGIIHMRETGSLGSNQADTLFGVLTDAGMSGADPAAVAAERGLLVLRDDAALGRWCEQAIEENPKAAEDVRAGKDAAIGRLVGAVMKLSAGRADASAAREALRDLIKRVNGAG